MDLQEQIEKVVEESLPDDSLFIVEVSVSEGAKPKVYILLDGDNGITIDQCAKVSRTVGNTIEENEWITTEYHLEVSSAGIGQPLRLKRQYFSNVGRKLEIQTTDGKVRIGKLEEVTESTIKIEEEIREKKKKKVKLEPAEIEFENISQTTVMVSF